MKKETRMLEQIQFLLFFEEEEVRARDNKEERRAGL